MHEVLHASFHRLRAVFGHYERRGVGASSNGVSLAQWRRLLEDTALDAVLPSAERGSGARDVLFARLAKLNNELEGGGEVQS